VSSIQNGVPLCKLHHAAFDAHFLAVRPDYIIEVRKDILEESDGPMLLYCLQGLHDKPLHLPARRVEWPDRLLLERRWERFVAMPSSPE
jgi:putative restriction endonuclease